MRISETSTTTYVGITAFAIALSMSTQFATRTRLEAADIFSNTITDPNPSTANPFTTGQTFDPNITVTGLGRGPGINANTGSNRYNATAWSFPSIDTNDYFTFTLTPNTGYEIDFASVSGQWQRSGTGPQSYLLATSLDGFAATVAGGGITGSGSAVGYNLDLSSLQNVTSAIELRLYAFAGTGASGTFSFNDFTFDGAVSQVTGSGAFAGDYNDDTVVDGADYVTWRRNLTDATPLPVNETMSLGTTDQLDYDEWRANFGNVEAPPGGGAGLSATGVVVPEPSPVVILLTLLIAAGCPTRRYQPRRAIRVAK